jgi:hypothetical protein
MLAWALALGTLAALAHAFLLGALARSLPPSAPLRLGVTLLSQAAAAFAAVALAALIADLPTWVGAAAGLWTAGLPLLVLAGVEGMRGVLDQIAPRAVGLVLCALAGALGARLQRRAPPAGP